MTEAPAAPIPSYLAMLNPEQREAVFHTGRPGDGENPDSHHPLLILAGAGSGKTRVITTKIAWLIREKGADPRSILAVTFTNKAAREMAERARLIDERAGDAMLRTFHSFGAWFLRRNGSLAGLDSAFVIYDDDDTVALLATLLEDTPKAEIKQIAHGIARAKDYFLSPEDPGLDLIDHRKQFRQIYARYEERLAQIGNVDFGDLIKKPVEILRSQPDVARRFRDRFRVIMVDEYQDANIAQFELLKELCGPETYICVVGDDDQSIYRFRGAEVRNILEFPDRFPGADIIRLERNYRSTVPILRAASSVVDHNESRLGKELRSERGQGKTPVLAFLPDQDEEANFCAKLIESSVKGGGQSGRADKSSSSVKPGAAGQSNAGQAAAAFSDWAILYRTNAQSLGFETEFLRRGIPYRVVGSLKFYEREEIKDALALLSFLVNPRDEIAFRRVVNKPARGVGPATVDRIVMASNEALGSFAENAAEFFTENSAGRIFGAGDLGVAAKGLLPELSAKARAGVGTFLKMIEEGRALLSDQDGVKESKQQPRKSKNREELRAGEGLSVLVVKLVKDSGIADYHQMNDEISGNQRLNNLQELANAASLYAPNMDGLLEFLEHIELDRSLEDDTNKDKTKDNAVTLITFHNTKGLEFRRVIMTGIEQGIFPREDKQDEELEEERRLFYVGATRAMDELYLTSCAMRRVFGRTMPEEPSLFLREIDKSVLRIIGDVPYGFGSGSGGGGSAAPSGYGIPGTRSGSGGLTGGVRFGKGRDEGGSGKDGGWRRGDRLYHDDHGYGAVVEVRDSEEGPVVRVQFETGKELRFLSLHQGSRFTKIGRDD
ncbi:DNA helicase [Spirochaetia bacterium]|nr:DNA helicase [Spirochaetia bacterium]